MSLDLSRPKCNFGAPQTCQTRWRSESPTRRLIGTPTRRSGCNGASAGGSREALHVQCTLCTAGRFVIRPLPVTAETLHVDNLYCWRLACAQSRCTYQLRTHTLPPNAQSVAVSSPGKASSCVLAYSTGAGSDELDAPGARAPVRLLPACGEPSRDLGSGVYAPSQLVII